MKRVIVAAIPIVMLTLAIPLVNRVEPRVLGMPFLLVWILAWIVITPAFMTAVYRMDAAR